eukprot:14155900-Alexandrium_andersonii.AAC.1
MARAARRHMAAWWLATAAASSSGGARHMPFTDSREQTVSWHRDIGFSLPGLRNSVLGMQHVADLLRQSMPATIQQPSVTSQEPRAASHCPFAIHQPDAPDHKA